MRRVVLNVAVTLDGYIAGPKGEYDWCFTDADYGMTEFMERVDAVLMGGKSYRLLLDYGHPYPDKTNYVLSRTEHSSPYENVVLVNKDIALFVEGLRRQRGKDIWLFGGAEIFQLLLSAGLVDELMLSVHPVVLGAGLPLFGHADARQTLLLKDTRSYPSGLVQITYVIKGNGISQD